jgi:hypothetical protein
VTAPDREGAAVEELARVLCGADGKVYWTPQIPAAYWTQARAVIAAGWAPPSEVTERERAAAEKALREAADAWTQGGWSDVMLPKPTPPAVPVIAYSNRVGDWLRARAERIGGDA